MASSAYRIGRRLAPGIVRIRLEGESAPGLAARLTALPGVQIVTGPDEYPNGRLYLTVSVSEQEEESSDG